MLVQYIFAIFKYKNQKLYLLILQIYTYYNKLTYAIKKQTSIGNITANVVTQNQQKMSIQSSSKLKLCCLTYVTFVYQKQSFTN